MIAPALLRIGIGLALLVSWALPRMAWGATGEVRSLRYHADTAREAKAWQRTARERLFELMMGGERPRKIALNPQIVREEITPDGLLLQEITIQSLPDRRVHAWIAVPQPRQGRVGAVLALHGHGGTGEQVVRGSGLYWYGRALAAMGYIIISPDIGSHELQHTNWSLMGERTWDALRCLDYLETRPEVDPKRLAVAGLSLGGETTMYVAALDERVKAVCSSGWLTTITNMKQGHCPCWNFPGLEEHFDFADIFALVAPRALTLEIGEKERAPGGFPVNVAEQTFKDILPAYEAFNAATNLHLAIHPGGHVFQGDYFKEQLPRVLGRPGTGKAPRKAASQETAWLQAATERLLRGSRIKADDGSSFFTPDGHGHYRALWTRDFAYMVEYAGDLLPPHEVRVCLDRLIAAIRADGAAPDRVRPDGMPVYTAGPENQPLGEPNIDNAQFLVIAAVCLVENLDEPDAKALFETWAEPLGRALDWIPRAESGLVWNDPTRPHSPYGFTDTVGKTGELFYESLLYWQANRRFAALLKRLGQPHRATEHMGRASRIENSIVRLWDERAGAFIAATQDCKQIDVWGNAYAIWIDFHLGKRRGAVLDYLRLNHDQFVWRGQVRHLPAPEHWQRLLTQVEPERYQNGAYWAAASGWMMYALAQKDRKLAESMWKDLIEDFKSGGICECINAGYRQLPDYVVSGTNPMGAARRLGF